MSVDRFFVNIAARYAAEVARGEHDDACEYDVRGFYLCHCSKRRREAAGHKEPPTDSGLDFPPPSCPRCDEDLGHDGDGWVCVGCSLSWDSSGYGACFTDEYGDDLAVRATEWAAKQEVSEGPDEKEEGQ